MSYEYQEEKQFVFTDEGQRMLIEMRDKAIRLCSLSGAVRAQELMNGFSGDSWRIMACVDRIVELGDLKEISNTWTNSAWQHRVFVAVPRGQR